MRVRSPIASPWFVCYSPNIEDTLPPPQTARRLTVRFWGVRGSVPTPRADLARYGGNTTCIQLEIPGFVDGVVIDAGTGIREFGHTLDLESTSHLLLSHFHWDHVQGLPFFQPLYSSNGRIVFYSDREQEETEAVLRGQMREPYFPVPFDAVPCAREYRRYPVAGELHIGPAVIQTFPLRHPQGALGFRVTAGGAVVTIVSDHEHGDAEIDRGVVRASEGADLLVHDAQYTPEEYKSRHGWGHSTWTEAVRVARASGAKRLLLTHHDPSHDDQFLDDMVAKARQSFENIDAAREFTAYEV